MGNVSSNLSNKMSCDAVDKRCQEQFQWKNVNSFEDGMEVADRSAYRNAGKRVIDICEKFTCGRGGETLKIRKGEV